MTRIREVGLGVALLALLVVTLLPKSSTGEVVRYLALGVMLAFQVLSAWAGYVRRRPYWTAESWRRYLKACAIPAGALLIMIAMMAALEWRLPITGSARSPLRTMWALATVAFLIVGAMGLATVVGWLNSGEPSRQFARPRWLGGSAES